MGQSRIGLIVAADEPALFFTSKQAAESYLEPIDVENGIFTAVYDSEGRQYEIGTEGGRVFIVPSPYRVNEPQLLRALLVRFLRAIGQRPDEDEDLDELISRCEKYIAA